jgi:hypothetical protein
MPPEKPEEACARHRREAAVKAEWKHFMKLPKSAYQKRKLSNLTRPQIKPINLGGRTRVRESDNNIPIDA